MRVVILGAGGCFGQNLAMYLQPFSHELMGIGRSETKPEPYSLGFEWDYRTYHLVHQFEEAWGAIQGFKPDVIINFAAHAGLVPQSWIYPNEFYVTNLLLPVKIAQRLDCRYFHIGSSEVYGSNTFPVDEDAPIRCSSPYAVSKAAADLHLMTLRDERITIIRPSNCYCPGQSLHRVIPRAIHAAITGHKMPLQGNPSKSYLHAEDLSAAIELLMRNPQPGIFNVGSDSPFSIHKIVEEIASQFGKTTKDIAEVTEGRPNEDACFWINSEKIKKLGWTPTIEFRAGMGEMAKWGRKYASQISELSTDYLMRP